MDRNFKTSFHSSGDLNLWPPHWQSSTGTARQLQTLMDELVRNKEFINQVGFLTRSGKWNANGLNDRKVRSGLWMAVIEASLTHVGHNDTQLLPKFLIDLQHKNTYTLSSIHSTVLHGNVGYEWLGLLLHPPSSTLATLPYFNLSYSTISSCSILPHHIILYPTLSFPITVYLF